MSVVIIVGVQWGDEGKGKVVDYLTENAAYVVRFQGGNNAGHTVIVDGQRAALRIIPSGILRSGTRCLLASGVVLDLDILFEEFESLKQLGVDVTPERLGIAGEVNLILPYHRAIDSEREKALGGGKIGTTCKGIGPAYEDGVSRYSVRLTDLFHPNYLESLIKRNVAIKNDYLKHVLGSDISFDAERVLGDLRQAAVRVRPFVANVSQELSDARRRNDYVVFEGAQGTMLDISHGTYPFVTSSNTVAGFACVSAGLDPRAPSRIVGICKAYTTRVGGGPFPTEDKSSDGEVLREAGGEFGTVTGRPRRCGWFDAVVARRAIRLNGIDALIVTKLDVLSEFDTIKVCTSYKLDGSEKLDMPPFTEDIGRLVPQYEKLKGWKRDITRARSLEDLPEAARSYLRRVEEITDCRVAGFSVGPEREQTVVTDDGLREIAAL